MPSPEEWPSRQQWRTKFGLQVRLLTISRPYLTIVIPTNGRDMLLLEGKSGGKSGGNRGQLSSPICLPALVLWTAKDGQYRPQVFHFTNSPRLLLRLMEACHIQTSNP